MKQAINDKIQELFKLTPKEVGVAYGKKMTDGEFTGELAIVFMVPKKIPSDQIAEHKKLPTKVNIDGVEYSTDVIEVGEIKTIASFCTNNDPNTNDNCYGWTTSAGIPSNQNRIRPIQGGIQITSRSKIGYVGTLGFLALDVATNAIVGVSNNHVLIGNAFYTNERVGANTTIANELDDDVFQNGTSFTSSDTIGKVMRYVPVSMTAPNQVDGALVALYSSAVSFGQSYLQYGLPPTLPMPFATTAEIDNALAGNYPLASSGQTTGAKIGSPCGVVINTLGAASYVSGYRNNGTKQNVLFNNLITFTRLNPNCAFPIYAGDSGSALLAFISGKWKIIGLNFAGGDFIGFACRIDVVAAQLGIKAWDGTAKPFINVLSKQVKAVYGTSGEKLLNCGGKTYWQVGNDYNTNYC